VQVVTAQKLQISPQFCMYLVISKCITVVIFKNISRHYLCNRSNSGIGCVGQTDSWLEEALKSSVQPSYPDWYSTVITKRTSFLTEQWVWSLTTMQSFWIRVGNYMELQTAEEVGRGYSISPFQADLVTSKHFTVSGCFINRTVPRPECPLESANR